MNMKEATIRLEVEPLDEGGYMASCPDVPGLRAYGATIDEATRNIQSVARAWVESCRQHREPIPAALEAVDEHVKVELIVPVEVG